MLYTAIRSIKLSESHSNCAKSQRSEKRGPREDYCERLKIS